MRRVEDGNRSIRRILLLVFCLTLPLLISSDVWCDTLSTDSPWAQALHKGAECRTRNFAPGVRLVPSAEDASSYQTKTTESRSAFQLPHCTRKIITDLSPDFVKREKFHEFTLGLETMMFGCFHEEAGYKVIVKPFRPGRQQNDVGFTCCAMETCGGFVDDMELDDYLDPYPSNDLILQSDPEFNKKYTAAWIDVFKEHNWQPCAFNSIIMITNRIIDFALVNDSHIDWFFKQQCDGLCAELTIVLIGRDEATVDLLSKYYGRISNSLYVVPNVECLYRIGGCFYPCITQSTSQCTDENLFHCLAPTAIPIPTTIPTMSTTERYPNSLHVMFVFAFSTSVTISQMENIRDSVIQPIKTYKQTRPGLPLTAAFLVPSRFDSPWVTDVYEMQRLEFTSSDLLHVDDLFDHNSSYTPKKIRAAISLYATHKKHTVDVKTPIIILLTDFVSVPFLDAYYSGLRSDLDAFSFRIYAYNKQAHAFFVDNNTVPAGCLYENDNLDNLKTFPLTDDDPSGDKKPAKEVMSELELLVIIVGCCALFLIVLIASTVIYRTKMSCWMDKIDRFRAKHQEVDLQPITEDYWELSWDRLLIKSEKIGSGAYGQVYRGKIHGRPPCVDHFYPDRTPLATQFENCDVAIKMLPKYATDAARKEFTNEIELMKTIGFNDNLVNMLGCITVGPAICLVLEYCPNRDLLQYVKALKVDVNISKSIDVKINYTKEFMLFAWQIADGMRFLASKHMIHRDLAARNVLIDGQKNAKISDFGLCIMLDENYAPMSTNKAFVSASGRLPIKWLAPEALSRHEFSSKSDVWSYGILLWEMYSFGSTPFNEVPPKELITHLESGKRPTRPILCSEEMYEVMERCWRRDAEKRPSFQELLTQLTLFLERATEGYGYIKLDFSPQEVAHTMRRNGRPTEISMPNTPNPADKRSRVFFRTFSSLSETSRPQPKHRIRKGTANAKILQRNSRSSNRVYESEKNGVDLERGVKA